MRYPTCLAPAATHLTLAAALAVCFAQSLAAVAADEAVDQSALARMPVKEVTVFKDGHAFVLHEGVMPTDEEGNVQLDYLPTPVIGTFWPYAAQEGVTLKSVVAGKRKLSVDRTALNVRDLLEANVGAKVLIKEGERSYAATIVSIPTRSAEEMEDSSPPNTGPQLPQKGQVIVLKTAEGYKVIPIETIRDVTFLEEPNTKLAGEEFRNLLSLELEWPDNETGRSAQVGMIYLQKGIRWIPNYRIEIDGKGRAVVQLQATLLNEMTDLKNVTANLVIGVPSFYFEQTTDPIALGQTVAQLSQYFQKNSQTAYGLSNSIMTTQMSRMGDFRAVRNAPPQGEPLDLAPDVANGGKQEDLFVFTVEGISLKKGQRMVLPVVEFPLEYEDVFTLNVPFAPPPEVRQNFNTQQQRQLAQLFHAPKVKHNIRLANASRYPLTTGPAVIVEGDRLLGQGLMTYTAPGGRTDLEITTAVDIAVHKQDAEVKRTPNAATWGGYQYDRIDLEGRITLANYRNGPAKLEVVRYVLGDADTAGNDGQASRLNAREDWQTAGAPGWWGWYSWPSWWYHFNGIGRFRWDIELDAGKSVDLDYTWHYYWRH